MRTRRRVYSDSVPIRMAMNDVGPLVALHRQQQKGQEFRANVTISAPRLDLLQKKSAYLKWRRPGRGHLPQNLSADDPFTDAVDQLRELRRSDDYPFKWLNTTAELLRLDLGCWASVPLATSLCSTFAELSVEVLQVRCDFGSLPDKLHLLDLQAKKVILLKLSFANLETEKVALVPLLCALLEKSRNVSEVIVGLHDKSEIPSPISLANLLEQLRHIHLPNLNKLVLDGNGFNYEDGLDITALLDRFNHVNNVRIGDVNIRGDALSSQAAWDAEETGVTNLVDGVAPPTTGTQRAGESASIHTPARPNPRPTAIPPTPPSPSPTVIHEGQTTGSTPLVQRISGFNNLETRRSKTDPVLKEELASLLECPTDPQAFVRLLFRDEEPAFVESVLEAIKQYLTTEKATELINNFYASVNDCEKDEKDMCLRLAELVDSILQVRPTGQSDADNPPRYRYANLREVPVKGSVAGSVRKPDGALVPVSLEGDLDWANQAAVFEVKLRGVTVDDEEEEENGDSGPEEDETETPCAAATAGTKRVRKPRAKRAAPKKKARHSPEDTPRRPSRCSPTQPDTQIASYMLEIRSSLGIRRYCLGFLVCGTNMQLQCCDPNGIVKTPMLDIKSYLPVLGLILWGVSRASWEVLGIDPAFQPPGPNTPSPPLPVSVEGLLYNVPGSERQLKILRPLHLPWGLIGRLTSVFLVVDEEQNTGPLRRVLKTSWPYENRPPEYDIIVKAKGLLENNHQSTEGLPYVYGSHQGINSNDCFRSILEDDQVLVPQQQVRKQMILELEELMPLSHLPIKDYGEAFFHIIRTLKDLHAVHIFHRDVNFANVMYRSLGNGRFQGVLIDFGYALDTRPSADEAASTDLQRSDKIGQHKSASRPFLPMEVLQGLVRGKDMPMPPLGRLDFESAFGVFMLQASTYPDGILQTRTAGPTPLEAWFGTPSQVLDAKQALYCRLTPDDEKFKKCSEGFKAIMPQLKRLADAFHEGTYKVEKMSEGEKILGNLEWVTMMGLVTPELVLEVFLAIAARLRSIE